MFVLMVAYATSVMRFKMRKPLMNMAVILNLFPGMLAMIAVYFTLKSFNLTNSYAGLIMVYSASSGLGWDFLTLCQEPFARLLVLTDAVRQGSFSRWYYP